MRVLLRRDITENYTADIETRTISMPPQGYALLGGHGGLDGCVAPRKLWLFHICYCIIGPRREVRNQTVQHQQNGKYLKAGKST
jgi:hypothetical protein